MPKKNRGGKRRNEKLPRYEKAKVSNQKIDNYILDKNNKNGKAGFFRDELGYNKRGEFRKDVKNGLNDNPAKLSRRTEDGARFFTVDMMLGVNKKVLVRTAWKQDDTKSNPQFITAYPAKKKKERKE